MLQTVQKDLDEQRVLSGNTPDNREPARQRPVVTFARGVVQFVFMAGILAGSAYAMNQLIAAKPERTGRPVFDVILPVQAVPVTLADQRPTVSLYGEVVAGRTVEIRSPISGEIIAKNDDLAVGNRVVSGVELFRVDPFEAEIALAEARANLAQTNASIVENQARLNAERSQLQIAREQLEFARSDLERAEQLRANGTLTVKQLDERKLLASQREQSVAQRIDNITIEEARLDQQLAARARLELGVERAARNAADTVVRAPFGGVIESTNVEPGRILSANEVAVSIYDDTALDVRFTLTNAQYGRIAVDGDPLIGRSIDLRWSVGDIAYEYEATVTRIGSQIAANRGGVDIFARIAQNDTQPVQIRPGAFLEVDVPDRLYPDAARLPETALYDNLTVYVIEDGVLASRSIELAAFDGEDIIIVAGLADGDMVLTTRISDAANGMKVALPGQMPAPSQGGSATAGGAPSPELIAAAKTASGLTDAQWDALPREERRPFIQAAREANQ